MSKVAIVGSGVVGFASGNAYARNGHTVLFIDVVPERLQYIRERGFQAFLPTELGRIHADFIVVSVPTPKGDGGAVRPDYVLKAMPTVAKLLRRSGLKKSTVVFRSTIPGRIILDVMIPEIERLSRLKAHQDFVVVANPEMLRAASAMSDALHPWAHIWGVENEEGRQALETLYPDRGDTPTFVFDIAGATLWKYAHNTFNAIKIAYFSECGLLAEAMGMSTEEYQRVADAVATTAEGCWNPRYGTKFAGPFGGACLSKDPHALAAEAERYRPMHLIRAALAVNHEMAAHQPEIPHGYFWSPPPGANGGTEEARREYRLAMEKTMASPAG